MDLKQKIGADLVELRDYLQEVCAKQGLQFSPTSVRRMARHLIVWDGKLLRRTPDGPKLVPTSLSSRLRILRTYHDNTCRWDSVTIRNFINNRV